MSEFSKRMAYAGDDALFEEHGDPLMLCPDPDAEPLLIQHAIISEETMLERDLVAANQIVYRRVAQFSTDVASPKHSGITNPLRKGTMIVDEIEYEVYSVSRSADGTAVMEGRRYGLVAVQRRDHDGGDY